jgi:hypothetical protein
MSSRSRFLEPQVVGSIHRWRFGDVSLEVDAAIGARVTAFCVGSENILTGPTVNPLNFGSTFWTSPQADWGWPPVVEIDRGSYRVTGDRADVRFESAPAGATGIVVTKRFRVDPDRELVEIEYTIENRSGPPKRLAPWEISRLPIGGLTFFPAGAGVQPRSSLTVTRIDDVIWFNYDPRRITDHQKVFAHGSEGWIAHIDVPRRLLLVKTFPEIDPGDQAPGEAQIEVYADPEHTYVEVEQQGAYQELAAAAQVAWTVGWRLRRLPTEIDAATGSKDLLALVRALVTDPRGY